jgi:eukaryotic-like serine/threonine-protein kinase
MSQPPSARAADQDEPSADQELVRHCSKCLAIYRNEFTRCPVDGAHIMASDKDPMLGVTIAEHYQIDELIGIGSSGRVYLAHHSRLAQRRFALKVLFGDLAATSTARMRFTHEAESASRLAHPNLVSVVDFGRTPAGLLYLAMDYIEGPNLARLIARDGAMPQERAVRMALQLCRGLAHAHDLGLVHRDFKPDNILVSNDAHGDVPRIVDFGIALSAADTGGDPRLTAMGVTLGTPAYAAPEQASDGEVDHRADLFALGVTLYEMLTGQLPFDGSLVEMMRQNATIDPPPMNERNPAVQVTAPLQQVVSKLMARDPAQRYQSARAVLDALAELPRRPGTAMRPSSTMPPDGGLAGGRLTPPGAAVPGAMPRLTPPGAIGTIPPPGTRGMTPPGMMPSSLPRRSSSPAIPMRRSSPVLPMRQSSPVIPTSVSSGATPTSLATSVPMSASIPMRPSTPSIPMRSSTPSIPTRASHPSIPTRASAPVIGPLVLPSSGPTRMPSSPVIEVPDSLLQRSGRIELAPLVSPPMASNRPQLLTLVLAVAIAAAVSAAAVVGYQRYTGKRGSAPAPAPISAPAPAPISAPAPAK